MIFKYLAEYRRVTPWETGRVGPLYWACVGASVLAVIFALRAIFALAR